MKYRNPLWNKLDREVLPFVTKPGRYVGNELNAIRKEHRPDLLKIALCFPEMYEIGMSYQGMQILYHIINKRSDCLAERAFAVWPDMEARMLAKDVPLFALESSTPLSKFDVLGFHLTYEMTFAAALNMLKLSGIPVHSKERDERYPLVIAGGPSILNPEPIADFFDLIFIGDAEEAIHELIDIIKDSKAGGLSRESTLVRLSEIPGAYIPKFYEPEYDQQGRFASLKKLNPMAPDKIKVRSTPELKTENYPLKPIVPFVETTHDHLAIEIMRGCVRGCRFCQAGYQYRPRRQRNPDDIASHLFSALAATGYDDITLLSLSSTDYDHIEQLLANISPRLSESRVGLALPSLRPETLTPFLLDAISSARKTGLTLAPEAGTERLRFTLGKKITDDDIFQAVHTALGAGWQSFKLYFMVGLPGETDEDLDGIVTLLRQMAFISKQNKGRLNINVALSPFNPKSHTPWQWEEQVGTSELKRRIDRIISGVRKPNINIRYRNLELSQIEGILGRGDRRIGRVIQRAFEKGARLDGWSEWFDSSRWYEAFANCNIDPAFYSAPIDENQPLPWDHIEKGISKDFLRKDNQKSKEGIPPPSALDKPKATSAQPTPVADDGYGRKARRLVRQSSIPSGAYKLRIHYSRDQELRYLSHLDIIRTLYRAIRRSGLPVAYSEGYHPHIKLSFGQPLPLGYTSEAEYLDLQLSQPYREEFIIRLKSTLPPGLEIRGHKHFFANTSALTKQLNIARYEIPGIEGIAYDEAALQRIRDAQTLSITRQKADGEVRLDVGKFIYDIAVRDGKIILDVWQTPDGHIKPDEIPIFGLGIDPEKVKSLMIHRKAQFNKTGQRLIGPLDLI